MSRIFWLLFWRKLGYWRWKNGVDVGENDEKQERKIERKFRIFSENCRKWGYFSVLIQKKPNKKLGRNADK